MQQLLSVLYSISSWSFAICVYTVEAIQCILFNFVLIYSQHWIVSIIPFKKILY